MNVYFSHSMLGYGTKKEQADKAFILKYFTDHDLIDPSSVNSKNMNLYYKMIEDCDSLVFTEHLNSIGKGVYCEIQHALKCGTLVFLLRKGLLYSTEHFKLTIFNTNDWKRHYAKVKVTEEMKGV